MMEFAGDKKYFDVAFPKIPMETKNEIIKVALAGGISWFDSAELYGLGSSEQALSAGLTAAGKQPGEVFIATKWFPLFRTARNIHSNIDQRIRALSPFPVDLYMVHQPFGFSAPEDEMNAMADLVEAGKIRSIGVSNFSARRMERASLALEKRGLSLAVNQMEYSLLNRKIEKNGVLAKAKELGVTIIAYTPLASGLLSGKYHQNPELLKNKFTFFRLKMERMLGKTRLLIQGLEEIGQKYQVTPAQVALNWVIHSQGEIVVTIPGATKVHHAQEAADAMLFTLTQSELNRLTELSDKSIN